MDGSYGEDEFVKLELYAERYSVCKLKELPRSDLLKDTAERGLVFLGVTQEEISLVVPEPFVPEDFSVREDGWRAFRVAGNLDFSLIGILAKLTELLAKAGVSVFAVSTYDTDYLLVKETHLEKTCAAFLKDGHEVEFQEKSVR